MTNQPGLPVKGYRSQPQSAIDIVNENKVAEERLLRKIDDLQSGLGGDPRWLALARTHLEIGFMALNRAIFRPARIELPEDTQTNEVPK